jgi:putative transcriptional regulator
MSAGNTTKKKASAVKPDWTRFDAMTEAERRAAAASDRDAKPLTPNDFKRMTRTPQVKIIRRTLGLTQEEFANRFHIPLGTLRDWEQGAATPDQSARAYLTVIARNPQAVSEALTTAK